MFQKTLAKVVETGKAEGLSLPSLRRYFTLLGTAALMTQGTELVGQTTPTSGAPAGASIRGPIVLKRDLDTGPEITLPDISLPPKNPPANLRVPWRQEAQRVVGELRKQQGTIAAYVLDTIAQELCHLQLYLTNGIVLPDRPASQYSVPAPFILHHNSIELLKRSMPNDPAAKAIGEGLTSEAFLIASEADALVRLYSALVGQPFDSHIYDDLAPQTSPKKRALHQARNIVVNYTFAWAFERAVTQCQNHAPLSFVISDLVEFKQLEGLKSTAHTLQISTPGIQAKSDLYFSPPILTTLQRQNLKLPVGTFLDNLNLRFQTMDPGLAPAEELVLQQGSVKKPGR